MEEYAKILQPRNKQFKLNFFLTGCIYYPVSYAVYTFMLDIKTRNHPDIFQQALTKAVIASDGQNVGSHFISATWKNDHRSQNLQT